MYKEIRDGEKHLVFQNVAYVKDEFNYAEN